MPTNDLSRRIAEAKGWTDVAPGHDGRLMGIPPGEKLLGYVPDWRGDPREFVPLWMTLPPDSVIQRGLDQEIVRVGHRSFYAPTLGDAVCLAWLAVNETKENGHES